MSATGFSRSPDVWERKSGGGGLIIFGLIFLAIGIFLLVETFGLTASKGDGTPWYFGIPLGSICAFVGALAILGRSGIIIDRRNGVLTQWRRLLGPLSRTSRTERELSEFDRVTVTRKVTRQQSKGSSQTFIVFPVKLEGTGDPIDINVHNVRQGDELAARKEAEELAAFLNIPLSDTTSGEAVVRAPDELDESLRDRIQKEVTPLDMPEPPPNMQAECLVKGDMLRIDIPNPGSMASWMAFWIGGLVVTTGFAAFVYLKFLRRVLEDDGIPTAFKVVWVGFIGLLFIGVPVGITLYKVLAGPTTEHVIVSPRSLEVTLTHRLSSKTIEIPAAELEELNLAGVTEGQEQSSQGRSDQRRGICANSDKVTIVFGARLPSEELRWIHASLKQVLSG